MKRWPGDIWTSGARGELIKRDYGQKYVCPERQLTLTKTIDDIDIPTRLEIFDIHGGKIQTRDFVCLFPSPSSYNIEPIYFRQHVRKVIVRPATSSWTRAFCGH